MLGVAVGWQLYDLTGSALDLGLVGLAQFLPMILLTLVVGQVADRCDRRLIVVVCEVVKAAAAAALALGVLGGWQSRTSIFALVGAAMLAVAVNEIGWKYHATEGKATVARLVAWPNKAGILAEYAQVTCDVRHADRAVADQMWAEVKAAMPECARRANVEMAIAGEWHFGSERFDPGCIRLIRDAARERGVAHRDILSQAGHDAYYISRIAPTAMIFTPCRDGISHNEAEHAELDYTSPGVNVLLDAVLARANR